MKKLPSRLLRGKTLLLSRTDPKKVFFSFSFQYLWCFFKLCTLSLAFTNCSNFCLLLTAILHRGLRSDFFFNSNLLFPIFIWTFIFPFLFGLLFSFSIWTFISLFYLDFLQFFFIFFFSFVLLYSFLSYRSLISDFFQTFQDCNSWAASNKINCCNIFMSLKSIQFMNSAFKNLNIHIII